MNKRSYTYWEQQRERSNVFMLKWLMWSALIFGRFIIRLVLWPIVLYFVLTAPAAVRASKLALRRLQQREATFGDVMKHFHCFATCGIDRLYLLKDKRHRFKLDVHRPEQVAEISAQGGCLLLVAHFGSFEALRAMGTAERNLPISMLMDRQQGAMLVQILEQLNPGFAVQIIDASERGPNLILQLKEALQAGRMVCIMADRARADERALAVNFCGSTTRFPEGPWALALALRVPVLLGFGIFRGGRRYSAHFELFSDTISAPRHERQTVLQHCAQRYAQRLEHYAREAPYNWFNYYDYWADDAPSVTPT